MTNDERLDRLTSVLTRAGSDIKFAIDASAPPKRPSKAVSEAGEIEFPPDFEIQFLTPEQRMKKLVLAMPDFISRKMRTPKPGMRKITRPAPIPTGGPSLLFDQGS